jgi:polyisoprenoid-binding protein YceI
MPKNTALISLLLILGLVAETPAQRAVDTTKSRAQFSVKHIWVESVTGTVPILDGSVTLDAGSIVPTRVSAVLDATNIATGEPDRDRSLESPDFFDSKRFPTWTFVSTKIVPKGPSAFDVEGSLTIHGVAQPERLSVSVAGNAVHPVYHATAQIDRHAFNMTVTRLDPTIGQIAEVTLDVALK